MTNSYSLMTDLYSLMTNLHNIVPDLYSIVTYCGIKLVSSTKVGTLLVY